ncbi:hypothetical protein LA080_003092 [Diaporthe eres]|nr:hypothetical protein LA080_003092 [Diaporthe eres]
MNNPAQQAQSPAPPSAPSPVPNSYHPRLPGGQGQYPFPHNVYHVSPPISSTAMPQSNQPPAPQGYPSPGHPMFSTAMGPPYMPPANMNMLNNQRPGQGGPGVLANHHHMLGQGGPRVPVPQVMAPNWNSPSGPQTPYHVANNSPAIQYVHTNASPGPSPALYQASPAPQHMSRPAQLAPQPMHGHGSVPPRAPRPGQPLASNGPGPGRNYAQIINGHHVPQGFRPTEYQTAGRSSQTPNPNAPRHVFNGGQFPQFMPPSNGMHQARPPTQPVPQPMTRYNLPSSTQTPPRSVQGSSAPPPVVSNGNIPQGNNIPPRNNMSPPATKQPASNGAKRGAADQLVDQQPTKRQRKPATPAQKPATPAQKLTPTASPAQQPPTTTDPEAVVCDQVDPLPPTLADEPQHLPDYELAKIETSVVVEPDITKPRPEGKEALAWDQAIAIIVELLNENLKKGKGRILRPTPLARLRELTDAIEEFIARPGRDTLLDRMAGDLLNVRYVRVIEDGIWDGQFDRIPERGWDIVQATTHEDKEKAVKEAWEKRAREYAGPSLAEAQKEIFKYF